MLPNEQEAQTQPETSLSDNMNISQERTEGASQPGNL